MNLFFCLCVRSLPAVAGVLCGEEFFDFSLRTGERRQCSRRRLRMQGKRKVLVLSPTFLSHLPWMADLVLREPIKSRRRLKGGR
jgi:hypothetical protein